MSIERDFDEDLADGTEYCTDCQGSGFRYYIDGGRDLCECCGGTGRL